jgi:AcrR family transcriptional regulator
MNQTSGSLSGTGAPGRPIGRRPGPSSTRADILEAARQLFAEVGFERATIRAIASRAGVDPALVHRRFGNKAQLLDAALRLPFNQAEVASELDASAGDEGRALLSMALQRWEDPASALQAKSILRVSMSNERAAAAVRDLFTREVLAMLAGRVPREDAELRAALVASQMVGLAIARFVIPVKAIAEADRDRLVDAVAPTIQRYLTGDV